MSSAHRKTNLQSQRHWIAGSLICALSLATVAHAESRYERYDFGTGSSPVLAGWTQLTGSDTLGGDPNTGFTGTRSAADVASGGDLMRDFVFHPSATEFQRALDNGQYLVMTALGRSGLGHSVTVELENEPSFDVDFASGEFTYNYTLVTIEDGRLNASVSEGPNAGSGGFGGGMIWNGLSITSSTLRYDMGSGGEANDWTEVAGGATGVYAAPKGYGWQTTSVSNANPGGGGTTADDENTDFAFSSSAANSFLVDLPNGYWEVNITVGRYDIDTSVEVVVDGDGIIDGGDTVLGFETENNTNPIETLTTVVEITDGQLTLGFSGGPNAGTSGYGSGWIVNSIELSPTVIPEPSTFMLGGAAGLLIMLRRRHQG